MGLPLQVEIILAFAAGLIILYIVGYFLLAPLRIILKLFINSVIGAIILWILNLVGGIFGITIGINPITALVVGIFGVPGVVLLLILQWLLGIP